MNLPEAVTGMLQRVVVEGEPPVQLVPLPNTKPQGNWAQVAADSGGAPRAEEGAKPRMQLNPNATPFAFNPGASAFMPAGRQ